MNVIGELVCWPPELAPGLGLGNCEGGAAGGGLARAFAACDSADSIPAMAPDRPGGVKARDTAEVSGATKWEKADDKA